MITFENIQHRLASYKPLQRGDHLQVAAHLPQPPYRPAAVLIPLLKRDGGYTILMTQRTAHLQAHAGQVSFPGGGVDEADADAIATALRETREEIGLDPARVSILGCVDEYITRTGYRVTPVVGLVDPPQSWQPDHFEVAHIFEVPLSYILSPDAFSRQKAMHEGIERQFYALTWQDFYIWGATAGMLKNFVDVIVDDRF